MKITLSDVAFSYGKRRGNRPPAGAPLLENISLTVEQGEMLALAGKSGSGKSTLLQLIKGFIVPCAGQIRLDGLNPHAERRRECFDRIGYIFQYPEHQLFASTVFADIAFGLRHRRLDEATKQEKVRQAMAAVQLDYDDFRDRSPFELSGGEKRRVAIAGIVVLEPEVLILDEPTAGLDLQSRDALFQLLHRLNREKNLTVIWVSHQLEEIAQHAARLVFIRNGAIQADGPPATLFADASLRRTCGWQEPPALVVGRLLRAAGHPAAGWLSPQRAADAIIRLRGRYPHHENAPREP
ncbi:ATP-binding cassette domain-containing protein [Brenneria corticis]|uniref:ABC transporter n=1 Tax=Brenneria corticis TaxID=2173106 RepID=A0A2U1U3V6_9GAMM|nr:ATP-binding cassette domain-containing protein [Brenneria sp. CFCC 11842]PWC16335.1 ABC transporter [Brenneria sp. CFCC 11842]